LDFSMRSDCRIGDATPLHHAKATDYLEQLIALFTFELQ
jgi:hypothetical protein